MDPAKSEAREVNKWDMYFADVALRTASLSYAERLKVGAVAVRDRRIVCVGYNGTPPGEPNRCEDENNRTLPSVIHAEDNLIRFAHDNWIDIYGCTLYVTHSPCINCANLIIREGFVEVVYVNEYRSLAGVEKLKENQIKVRKYDAN